MHLVHVIKYSHCQSSITMIVHANVLGTLYNLYAGTTVLIISLFEELYSLLSILIVTGITLG